MIQVQIVTRHGARSPYQLFPDEWDTEWNCTVHPAGTLGGPGYSLSPTSRLYSRSYIPGLQVLRGNCAQGELTEQGSQMHVALGQQIRQQYASFLPGNFSDKFFFVRSTDVPRTIESAGSFLSGMYPSSTPLINIWLIEAQNDNMQLPSHCGLINQLCNAVQSTPEWVSRLLAMQPLQQKLIKQWGIPASEFPVWTNIQSTLQCRNAAGVPNPSYLSTAEYNSIMDLANWQMAALWNSTRQAQLITGLFLNQLLGNINAAISNAPGPSFFLFSGHDTTIGPLLAALEAFPTDWPPFAARVQLELYQNASSSFFVRGLYNGQVIYFGNQNPCDEYCPFSQFKSIIAKYLTDAKSQNDLCSSVPYAAGLNDYTTFLC
ncbi:MAG: histidine-type phosphatase [archaeon]|nr:histidine-type phosphatase [archaeon]